MTVKAHLEQARTPEAMSRDAHASYPACGMPYTGRRFAATITPHHAEAGHAP